MKITATIPDHGALVMAIMEGFVQAAQLQVRAGVVPPLPSMVAGLKFIPEPDGQEEWLLPNQVAGAGGGDCEDLAFWEAAGLRELGIDPGASALLVQTGPSKLHCVVQMSDGSTRDPSLVLQAQQHTLEGRRKAAKAAKSKIGDVIDHRTPQILPELQRKGYHAPVAPKFAGLKPADAPPTMQSQQQAAAMADAFRQARATGRGLASEEGPFTNPAFYGQSMERHVYADADAARAAGLVQVQDDQTGQVYWEEPDEISKLAWQQGMSPDDLRQQLQDEAQYEQQAAQYGGAFPDMTQYGGYPNPYGQVDPFLYSGYGDPAAFYGVSMAALARDDGGSFGMFSPHGDVFGTAAERPDDDALIPDDAVDAEFEVQS